MTHDDRRYFLEHVDDIAVVQCYADAFETLTLDQKRLAWHLYRAALAGRDIYYDQRCRHALDMRAVLEGILRFVPAAEGALAAALAEVRRYTKLFWINSGPYEVLTARKFVLRCRPDELRELVRLAEAAGARFPLRDDETVDDLLERLRRPFFDPEYEPLVTSKVPGPGGDVLTASANNLYVGVSLADLEGFQERYPLNSRLVRTPDGLVEQVYRIGGLYGEQIARIVEHLRLALPWAPAPTRRALEALIRFYESGETADRVAYDIAWVQDQDAPVDTINGFIEVYLDARGVKGAWEGIVYCVNRERTEMLERLAAAAPAFELRMPWKDAYRRTDVVGVTARAVDTIVQTGDAGPMSAIGINLPNDEHIRERYGSKSVTLVNVIAACERSEPRAVREEFCWDDDERARAEKWGPLAGELATAIHEVLGHGSGRVADRLEGQPQRYLRETYSTIEETRADLVALYVLGDPYLAEIGVVPADDQPAIVQAEYEAYARNVVYQLRRVRSGDTLEEDHMRNRQLIIHWLLEHTDAIEIRRRDGRTYYVVVSVEAFRAGCARLLADVQAIKAEGDYQAARRLVETYGTRFDPALRDEVVARAARHNLPSATAFVQPDLEPVYGPDGSIVDVRVSYPLDLQAQMLAYSSIS